LPTPARSHPLEPRLAIVDVARGLAIAQMIAYHFCYDLNHFSWIHVAMTRDGGWIAWRTAIVSQFLFLVGVSLALRAGAAATLARPRTRFWRRWGQIAACAALVSFASWWLFGPRLIWFGVLHFVALAQLLLTPLVRFGTANVALGAVALAAGILLHFPLFAADALSWIGFSPGKPHTEDFVPLFPWLGVVLLGIGLAHLWQRSDSSLAQWLRGLRASGWGVLSLLGRWPLTVYILHQPLLFGAFALVDAWYRSRA